MIWTKGEIQYYVTPDQRLRDLYARHAGRHMAF